MMHFILDGVPPSTNHAYGQRHGKRFLTKEGKAYKTETKAHLVREYGLNISTKKDVPYALSVVCYFTELQHKGWPETVDTRYKKLDASNRVKLLEDALVEALGIDDSQFFQVTVTKLLGKKEQTLIWVWEYECPPHLSQTIATP
jgi:Holliday junction resolvase RusA-like endonuclease